MADRPILFSAPMVRAILAGTKTQTRRTMKPQPFFTLEARSGFALEAKRCRRWAGDFLDVKSPNIDALCPYGQPGDRLWVRETWARPDRRADNLSPWVYAADYAERPQHRWKPSIHMQRAASRTTLEVTGVRVERLQDISEADAYDEGAAEWAAETQRDGNKWPNIVRAYQGLWESINGPGSWDANPWVWVLSFRRIDGGGNG